MQISDLKKQIIFSFGYMLILFLLAISLLLRVLNKTDCLHGTISCLQIADHFSEITDEDIGGHLVAAAVDEPQTGIPEEGQSHSLSVEFSPESGTIVFYEKATELNLTVKNKGSGPIYVRVYSGPVLVGSMDLDLGQTQINTIRINPRMDTLTWKIYDSAKELGGEGSIELSKFNKQKFENVIRNKTKMLILE